MKKFLLSVAALVILTGCASTMSPVSGSLALDLKGPMMATGVKSGAKTGEAKCTTILGIFASGDCSLEAARNAGGITNITEVDYKVVNYLGFYAELTTVVRGN